MGGLLSNNNPMFEALKPVPSCFYYLDRMNEINGLLQNNFLMIADLESVIRVLFSASAA